MLNSWLILTGSLIVLGIAANYLVHSSVKIAKLLKVSEMFIGLTIVAWGTSAPEVAVSAVAALDGKGALSVGNVIGSNIFNLGFILGIVALIAPQAIKKKMVYRDGTVLFVATLTVLTFVWDGHVTIIEGLIMLGLLIGYASYLFIKKDIPAEELEEIEASKNPNGKSVKNIGLQFFVFGISLYILVKASEYTVSAATDIALTFGISEWAIGATIVAAGTSLPEVATSVIATIKRKFDLSVGNVIGSDIFNALGIIGISAVLAPLQLTSTNTVFGLPDYLFSQVLLVLTIVVILIFMRTKWTLSRFEGGVLLVTAASRMAYEIYLGSSAAI